MGGEATTGAATAAGEGRDGDGVDAREDRDGVVDAGDHSPRAGGDPAVAASSRGGVEGEESCRRGMMDG
jgi:hypothetical protein